MGEYTPGPWRLGGDERLTSGRTVWSVNDHIADVMERNSGFSHEACEANARLIAEAPAMLEALLKLANEAAGFLALSDIERHGVINNRTLRQRIEEARDVIAKARATGEKEQASE